MYRELRWVVTSLAIGLCAGLLYAPEEPYQGVIRFASTLVPPLFLQRCLRDVSSPRYPFYAAYIGAVSIAVLAVWRFTGDLASRHQYQWILGAAVGLAIAFGGAMHRRALLARSGREIASTEPVSDRPQP